MDFYYLPSNLNYLSCISKYLVETYPNNLDKIKIFFSHSLQCQIFQKYLIDELKNRNSCTNFFLPKLISIGNLWENFLVIKEGESIYSRAKPIEEVICLAKNMLSDFGIVDSFEVSYQLYQVLKEIAENRVDIKTTVVNQIADQSIHLQEQLKLLVLKNEQLRNDLKKQNKLTAYDFDTKLFTDYLNEYLLKKKDEQLPTIFIGMVRQCAAFNEFLLSNLSRKDFIFILPPIDDPQNINLFHDTADLLDFLKIKKESLQVLDINQKTDLKLSPKNAISNFTFKDFLDLNNDHNSEKISHISLIEAEDEIEESNIIFLLIKNYLDENPNSSIGLMLSNKNIINFIINNLKKHSICFSNFIGEDFLDNKLVQFILCITNSITDSNTIGKLLSCLKHPFLFSSSNCSVIEQIIRKNVFINNPSQIERYIEDKQVQEWWNNFYSKIKNYASQIQLKKNTAIFLVQISLKAAEDFYPDIWRVKNIDKIVAFFQDLIEASKNFGLIEKDNYYNFLKTVLKKNKTITSNPNARVTILTSCNAFYLNFDLVILNDMLDSSKSSIKSEMWITKSLRSVCKLKSIDEEFYTKMQDFYLLLCNREVILTRAKKINNSTTNASKLLQQIYLLADRKKLVNITAKNTYLAFWRSYLTLFSNLNPPLPFYIPIECFPDKISATNLELLIKNPQGFYAKNILKLYPCNEINKQDLNAEFGTLLHQIICSYNRLNFDEKLNISLKQALESFLYIANLELKKLEADEFITNLWWPKIECIAEAYVSFNQLRSPDIQRICSEIYGEIYVECLTRRQKVLAIADEIILMNDGQVYIIDYKTGALPSKKDVLSGLSPQLITEGLILERGGFKGLPSVKPSQIIFIKLSTTEPYIHEVSIQDIDFKAHYLGLQNLLNCYLTQESFYPVLPNKDHRPKYDQYRHLGRKNYFLLQ